MIRLYVWLTLTENTPVLVGELIAANPDSRKGGFIAGQFRYSKEYLDWDGAFPLDPVHLPLSQKIFDAGRVEAGVHGVFEDCLPDDWGRRLLARKHNLAKTEQRPPNMLEYLAGNGMGALSFSKEKIPPPKQSGVSLKHLEKLRNLAGKFEENLTAVDKEYSILFEAGSSPGGARPKALVQDDDTAYLAKFESIKDTFDVVGLEAAAMELAGMAGVECATTKCISCGNKKVLLVKRFDRDLPSKKITHVITMQTLLGADGYYHLSYRDMANIIRKVSTDPRQDLIKLFRQLVFNVLIGNTDDHLKNFSMIYDAPSWRLSPAYDIVPNIGQNREHVLSINFSNGIPNRTSLLQEAKHYGFKQEKNTIQLIAEVVAVVKNWQTIFGKYDIPTKDIDCIGKDIENRLSRIH